MSRTTRGGATTTGALWQAGLNRAGRRYSLRYSVQGNAPDFNAPAGFISRQGIVNGTLQNQMVVLRHAGALVEKLTRTCRSWHVALRRLLRGPRRARTQAARLISNFSLHGGWQTGASVLFERYDYDPSIFTALPF